MDLLKLVNFPKLLVHLLVRMLWAKERSSGARGRIKDLMTPGNLSVALLDWHVF